MKAREIMDTTFQTLRPEDSISEAVQRFSEISKAVGRKMFGLMVIDASDQLLGMLSMYDILQFIQPKHIHKKYGFLQQEKCLEWYSGSRGHAPAGHRPAGRGEHQEGDQCPDQTQGECGTRHSQTF